MDIVCQACSTRLSIPDDRLPKNVPAVTGKCPNCQAAIEIRLDGGPVQAPPHSDVPAPAPAAAAPPAPAPATTPPPAPVPRPRPTLEVPSGPIEVEEFVEGRKLALLCVDGAAQAPVKEALEGLEYTVHVAAKPQDGIQRLRRNKYEVLILQETFGGSAQENVVLGALQPMAMSLRRHMCVGLLGADLYTLDNMTAFAKSVNFVVGERDLSKVKSVIKQAVADNDQFYHAFRQVLKETGKG